MKKKKKNFLVKIILIIFVIVSIMMIQQAYYQSLNFVYKKEYSEYVEKYAKLYNLDEKLIYAIIKNESNFNKDAISPVGAVGLMQIMESTADDVAKQLNFYSYDLHSPEDNIKIGAKYFSDLLKKYGKTSLALAAYNAGFGNVDSWINDGIIKSDGTDYENIPYKETNMYVRKILRDYDIYISRIS